MPRKKQANVAEAVVVGDKTKQFEEAYVPIVGTAPALFARAMPWDIGPGYWDQFPLEIRERRNPADVLSPLDRELLKRHGFEVNGKLTSEANAYLRCHWLPDLRLGFPATGFMGAVRTAVVQYKGKGKDAITAKKIGGAMQIFGDPTDQSLVHIDGTYGIAPPILGTPKGPGSAPRLIVRMRVEPGWKATLHVRWLKELISAQQIIQAIEWAGNWGIGQWRPSSAHSGTHGTFSVTRLGFTVDKSKLKA